MKYIRTNAGIHRVFRLLKNGYFLIKISKYRYYHAEPDCKQADTIEELCDEIVLIENGNEHNIVYLQEGYDRIIEYHEEGNYEPRLIGRIKVDLDKKAIAEWKENKQGLYDWVLL